jgi:hypothetical protein
MLNYAILKLISLVVDSMVMGMGEKFYIKSQGIASMSNNQNVGFSGTVDLPFNMRLASVKSYSPLLLLLVEQMFYFLLIKNLIV